MAETPYSLDVARLTKAVAANKVIINSFGELTVADKATIASLKEQLAAAQAANPDVDLSGLEADIATLEASNQAAASFLPPPVEVPPVEVPTV